MSEITVIQADTNAGDVRIAIVMSKYNSYIVDRLLQGCLSTLRSRGVNDGAVTLVKVPGAFEIPVIARKLAINGGFDAIVTLGAVIRGETPHFDFISQACSTGIAQLAAEFTLPVIFGVLTVNNAQQALDRSGEEESNKGSEAAMAALEMIGLMRNVGT